MNSHTSHRVASIVSYIPQFRGADFVQFASLSIDTRRDGKQASGSTAYEIELWNKPFPSQCLPSPSHDQSSEDMLYLERPIGIGNLDSCLRGGVPDAATRMRPPRS